MKLYSNYIIHYNNHYQYDSQEFDEKKLELMEETRKQNFAFSQLFFTNDFLKLILKHFSSPIKFENYNKKQLTVDELKQIAIAYDALVLQITTDFLRAGRDYYTINAVLFAQKYRDDNVDFLDSIPFIMMEVCKYNLIQYYKMSQNLDEKVIIQPVKVATKKFQLLRAFPELEDDPEFCSVPGKLIMKNK